MSSDQPMVKKKKTSSSLAPKRAFIYLTIRTLGSRNRKSVEVFDLENLESGEALKKLITFFQFVSTFVFSYVCLQFHHHCILQVVDHICRSTKDLKAKLNQAEQALKEQERINKEILQRVDKLFK